MAVHQYKLSNLSKEHQALVLAAKNATKLSYAPYSSFFVGAAILTVEHKIYSGQNQENAAYPACMCAERVALYHYCAVSQAPIIALGIYAENRQDNSDHCAAPCGNCRQVILEYRHRQDSPFPIFSLNQEDRVRCWDSIDDLLPEGFHGGHLKGLL